MYHYVWTQMQTRKIPSTSSLALLISLSQATDTITDFKLKRFQGRDGTQNLKCYAMIKIFIQLI